MSKDVRDNPGERRLEITLDDGEVAIAAYRREAGRIEFTHTVVPPAFRGQGLGRRLVEAGLDAARREGLKVVPSCALFAGYMKDHAETHDLLTPDSAKTLGVA